MTEGRRARRVSIVIATLLVLGALLLLDSTLGMQPAACASCHAEFARGQEAGPHASLSCFSCHLESGAWSRPGLTWQKWTVMYPRQVVGAPPRPARDVSRDACVSCHGDVANDSLVYGSGLRILHSVCVEPPARCTACHGAVSHGQAVRWGQQPEMDACIACHVERSATLECDACHVGRLEIERLRRGPWRVTHGPEWSTTHAMGDYSSCVTCHEPDYCARCHDVPVPHPLTFGSTHGSFARDGRDSCAACHQTEVFCDGCHGVAMPHPDDYLRVHSSDAVTMQDERCLSCHTSLACDGCHVRHVHPGGATLDVGERVQER